MQGWARFVARTPWLWICVWPLAALAIWTTAPRIPTLLVDDDNGFLPSDMPSHRAFEKLQADFPDHAPASRVAVVFVRESGLTEADRDTVAGLARSLADQAEKQDWQVRAAVLTPYLRPLLESSNGKAAVVLVDLPAQVLTHNTVNRTRAVQRAVADLPSDEGLEIQVTGGGALAELLDANTKRDVDRTTLWAFAAVTLILLLIYRSPIAMLLPVVTIALSLMVSLGLLGWAATAGWPINGLVEMFIIVILVGSGVDYCLFLFARFTEEMRIAADVCRAVEIAVARSGGAILASAGTNAVGLATLALGRNRDLYTSGPTIAAAICIATLAVLTLAPAMIRLTGHQLFWPARLRTGDPEQSRLWTVVARLATCRPVTVMVIVLGALIAPAAVGARVTPLYDSYEEYPADSAFVRGARLYEHHFFDSQGVSEQSFIITTDARLDSDSTLPALHRALDAVAAAFDDQFPVLYQRDLGDPLGIEREKANDTNTSPATDLTHSLTARLAQDYYVGKSGRSTRIDYAVRVAPRSIEAMEMLPKLRATARRAVEQSGLLQAVGGSTLRLDVAGDTALYADIRALRSRDFGIIAVAAIVLIYLILLVLTRSAAQSLILVAATLLTYLGTYGLTWLIFHYGFGVTSLNYQISFLLFVIILALGQDYNIYVVTRIREQLGTEPPKEAIATAVSRTGGVVSSCGIIMAAAFASMFSGSLLIMKEFAVALSMGILMDTFIIRPLLVPAGILLLSRCGCGVPASRELGRGLPLPAPRHS